MLKLEIDGKETEIDSTGDGPVDATFNAINALFPHEANLQLYQFTRSLKARMRKLKSVFDWKKKARRLPVVPPIRTQWWHRRVPMSVR